MFLSCSSSTYDRFSGFKSLFILMVYFLDWENLISFRIASRSRSFFWFYFDGVWDVLFSLKFLSLSSNFYAPESIYCSLKLIAPIWPPDDWNVESLFDIDPLWSPKWLLSFPGCTSLEPRPLEDGCADFYLVLGLLVESMFSFSSYEKMLFRFCCIPAALTLCFCFDLPELRIELLCSGTRGDCSFWLPFLPLLRNPIKLSINCIFVVYII